MIDLNGKWIGQYSQLSGAVESKPMTYDSFEIQITDNDGEIHGSGKDINLDNEPFTIQGFHENGAISFIKKYERLIFQDEKGDIYSDDASDSNEIHYYGSYNAEESVFQGFWEIKTYEEKDGLQDAYLEEYESGQWFLKKAE